MRIFQMSGHYKYAVVVQFENSTFKNCCQVELVETCLDLPMTHLLRVQADSIIFKLYHCQVCCQVVASLIKHYTSDLNTIRSDQTSFLKLSSHK